MKTNTQKGSVALWIVIAAVVVLGAGTYYYYTHSSNSNGSSSAQDNVSSTGNPFGVVDNGTPTANNPTNTANNIMQSAATPPAPSGQTNTVSATLPSATNLTCGSISTMVNSMVPTVSWKAAGGPQPSKTLNCSYIGFGSAGMTGIFSVWLDQNLPTVSQAVNDFEKTAPSGGFSSINCAQSSFISGSSECSWVFKVAASKISGLSAAFVSSDGKYTVGVGLGLPSGADQQMVEQIAKEINSKI